MQDREIPIGVCETLGDIFENELEIVGVIHILSRYEIIALTIRDAEVCFKVDLQQPGHAETLWPSRTP
jgi:hypothetical protein